MKFLFPNALVTNSLGNDRISSSMCSSTRTDNKVGNYLGSPSRIIPRLSLRGIDLEYPEVLSEEFSTLFIHGLYLLKNTNIHDRASLSHNRKYALFAFHRISRGG